MKTIWLVHLISGWDEAPERRSRMLEETGVYVEVPLEVWRSYTDARKALEASILSKPTARVINDLNNLDQR